MSQNSGSSALGRRGFLKAGAAATLAAGVGSRTLVEDARSETDETSEGVDTELVKTICSHCAVGCGLKMEVQNDAIVGQESWDDHPINQGGLCSKGASLSQTVNSPNRLKEPMKKEGGDWVRLDWDEAMSEVADELSTIGADVTVQRLVTATEGSDRDLVLVDRSDLTDRQLDVLETAHRMGYFEPSGGANATDVAAEFDLAVSTVTQHLSAAQAKLLDAVLSSTPEME